MHIHLTANPMQYPIYIYYHTLPRTSHSNPLHILHHVPQPRPHLLGTRQNLLLGQHKPIATGIPQLDRHTVRRLCNFKRVVDAVTADLVNGITNGAAGKRGAVDGFDGGNGARREGRVLCGVGDRARTCVAVGIHPELAVGMHVHVERYALSGCNAVEMGFEGFGFDAVACRGAFVVVGAGRGRCAVALVPVRRPVA